MIVTVELLPERTPGRYPQVAKSKLFVDEIEIVVQALAQVGLECRLARGLVVPRPAAIARIHGRDHVHQPRMIATAQDYLRHHFLFSDVRFVDVLNLHARLGASLLRARTDALAQRFCNACVVNDADAARVQKARHPARVAHPRQCARDNDSVVTGQHAKQAFARPPHQHLSHRHARPLDRVTVTLSCLIPAPSAWDGTAYHIRPWC